MKILHRISLIAAVLLAGSSFAADPAFPPLSPALLDESAFRQSAGGVESPIPERSPGKGGPKSVVWTTKGGLDIHGILFGEGRELGRRHLRIGFTEALPVGSVLVHGGGVLSVLKPDAPYPGDLTDDSQWISAERLLGGAVSRAPVTGNNFGFWLLPDGTRTRALRFSHESAAGDRQRAGSLGGVWVLPERLVNMAPQAVVQSSARDDVSARLVDESHNSWGTWDNGENGAATLVSPEHPELVTLVWPKVVTLRGVCLLWTGFQACELEAFTGRDDAAPATAPDSDWQRVATADRLDALYPVKLSPQWVAFERTVSTRALRMRITGQNQRAQGHLTDKVKQGHRVWLGEFAAFSPLAGEAALASLILPKRAEEPPPIPIRFTLPEAGLVTLVIEDPSGRRIRNLVSETPFPAGENTAWWDGSDDLLRDTEAAKHGVYQIPSRPVAPGAYKVRGLWRSPLSLHYEFSIYNAGKPGWSTADNTGCWLTTHTPPTSVAVVPGSKTADGQPLVFIGASVAEGGHGLQWLREDGTKIGGQHWVGGTWTGAPTLAVDRGPAAVDGHLCYVGSAWEGELRLTAKTRALGDQAVAKLSLGEDPNVRKNPKSPLPPPLEGFEGGEKVFVLSGIAARDGVLVCSMLRQNELLFVDVASGKLTGRLAVESPRGVAFDASGRMLVLSGSKVLRFASTKAAKSEVLVSSKLEDPRHVAVDDAGRLWISDRGASHQVKVFSPKGRLERTIGEPGAPAVGPYRPLHMNLPNGLALDTQGHVWVAEASNRPRRVSVWSSSGALERTYYGPTEYGGGGTLDPGDRGRFFYRGMEFALDWEKGTDQLVRIYAEEDPHLKAHYGAYSPDTPLYPGGAKGPRYFTSCYTHNPTSGDSTAFLWRDDGTAAKLTASLGDANAWELLASPEFRSLWPEGTEPGNSRKEKSASYLWVDRNGDGRPQPHEVTMKAGVLRGVTVMQDLSFVVSRFGENSARFAPRSIAANGVPDYVFEPQILGPAGGNPASSGGDQTLVSGDWSVHTNAPQPYSAHGIGGSRKGEPVWSYPSPWPGLHASHEAAVPDRPGMVVGHTRLLGDCIGSAAGPLFAVNGNMGNAYLFTVDGLFVATLFNDIRLRPNWAAPVATRNMDVTDVSLHDENFWPSITQTPDGRVFLIDGGRTSLVRVDGLESLRRIPDMALEVTAKDLDNAREWLARSEAARQAARGTGTLAVRTDRPAPTVDGQLNDWPADTAWAMVDRRGTKANFNSNSRPYEVSAAVAVADGKLFAAWRTTEKDLLNNSGETPDALFKTGGCLDLMLQADTEERLLVTLVKGKPRAVLYRAKVQGTVQPVAFSSPWRTIHLDTVEDVSAQVSFATDKAGNFEVSVPLSVLHWEPKPGGTVRADLGVLRGSNGQTTQRVYWANKATAITADVPSEAELTPKLWGQWKLQ